MKVNSPNSKTSSYKVALAGRPTLNTILPSDPIGTPERQVFAQIYDTLVTLSPELEIRSSFANFEYIQKDRLLQFNWEDRYFHNGQKATAELVLLSLQRCATKFARTHGEIVDALFKNSTTPSNSTIRIENVDHRTAVKILRMLTLPDFGIHLPQENSNTGIHRIGTGPYILERIEDGRIALTPFEFHPQREISLSRLEFIGAPASECMKMLSRGEIDEFLSFESPNNLQSTSQIVKVPSLRANVGLLLINPRSNSLKDFKARVQLAARFYRAVCEGAHDDTWSVPAGIIPPGHPAHASVDYLKLHASLDEAEMNSDGLEGPIRIAVTNARQKSRLERIFGHSSFSHWNFEINTYSGYQSIKDAAEQDSNGIDCAFLAVRGDRGDVSEFFEFFHRENICGLFDLSSVDSSEYSRLLSAQSDAEVEESASKLERSIIEQLICLPIGYYHDVRVVSSLAPTVVGLSSHDGPPRYLAVRTGEVLVEIHRAQQNLLRYYEQQAQRRTDQSLYLLASRTAHDLKSPLAALQVISKMISKDEDAGVLLLETIRRIEGIIEAALDLKRDRRPQNTDHDFERIDPVDLSKRALREVSSYTQPGLRFHLSHSTEMIETSVRIPRCDLRSILVNLIKNSCESLAPFEGGDVNIRIEALNPLQIQVSDSGPGFDQQAINSFGKSRYTNKAKGSGLGLLHARRTLNQIGGEITISNGVSGGAQVLVTVPSR